MNSEERMELNIMIKLFKSTDIGEITQGENVGGKEQMFRTKH